MKRKDRWRLSTGTAALLASLSAAFLSCAGSDAEHDGEADVVLPETVEQDVPDDAGTDRDSPVDGSSCEHACEIPGSSRCMADTVQVCDVDPEGCRVWSPSEDCAAGGQVCKVDGEGRAFCVPQGVVLESKGMWVWGSSIRGSEESFMSNMAAHGISDVFVLIKGASGQARHDVLDALLGVRDDWGYDIHVWAWILCFDDDSYADDFDGSWVDPEDETYRARLLDFVDETLVEHGPDGIMLDCVRYPGNAAGRTGPITSFCGEVRARVDGHNADSGAAVLAGAAVMPEFGGANESAYGQDVEQMARHMDVIAPMVYRYNYSATAAWITSMTEAAAAESGGEAAVWPVLQNYEGDDSPAPLDEAELRADILAALDGCPEGFSIFQYNLLSVSQWIAIDVVGVGDVICGSEEAPPPESNLDFVIYHQQPLSSNDDGPFYGSSTYEGWCNTASLYMVLHSFIPDLPRLLHDLDPAWTSWRGGGLPADDPYFYSASTTYNVEEFLQDRYLGYLIDSGGIGYEGIRTMMEGVAGDLGVGLTWTAVPLADVREYLASGWLAIMNNWEWGGHYFVVAWYEAGADPDDPAQRFYYILDPTNMESDNSALTSSVDRARTESFRELVTARQPCGDVSCSRETLGIYVLNADGVNALYKGNQPPEGHVPMIRLE